MLDDFADAFGEYGEMILKYWIPIIIILGVLVLYFILKAVR